MNRTAFVVDDEELIASTLGEILTTAGFNALWFSDPSEALNAALSVAPDFLLTDVMMPGMNGIELAKQLKARCPNCSVLLCSGQAGTSDMMVAASKDGYNFELLAKPLHPQVLMDKIEQLFTSAAAA